MKPLDPRLVRRSRTVRHYLLAGVALGILTALLVVTQAYAIAATVARLFDGRPVASVAALVGLCLGARAVVEWCHSIVATRAAGALKSELRCEILNDLVDPRRLGPAPRSSRVIVLLGRGLDAFDGYVGRYLPQTILATVVPVIVVIAVMSVDPLSAVIIGLSLPLSIVFMVLVGLATRDKLDRRWAALQRLGQHFANVLDGLVILKVFGRDQTAGLRAVGERHRKETIRSLRVAFLSSLVLELVATLSVALIAVSVGLRVVDDRMSLQDALTVLLLAPEAYLPIRRLGAMFHDSKQGVEAASEALDLLDHDRHTGHLKAPDPGTSTIRLHHVTVEFPGRTTPALHLADETIRPGEFVALAGPSGSGKSTLLDVLMSFLVPTSGHVTVGGIDLAEIDPDDWRRHIAWVPQIPGIIDGTVADNVRMSNVIATELDVARALADAGAADLSPTRRISETADDISAGERRRIAIARALLRVRVGGARLVLLDEPTAGLDATREATILTSLRALEVTVLVVAHRPETIAAADRVIQVETCELMPV
ncbi:thiol reductant ABC exporter subunit CydD [Aeromicrobium sp. 9AM]|uniref:thiol reductant ABC exporter subunit CydD n=1 Tax=Aeromicrobium sp. 9AM TaxID=2653126 RepID=UPI0012F2D72A|nr:thiol reductant ABC exporter subunit CydD [Aeromicrobium sp. 9AM]VXC11710.1 Thiol reductant ABC exporter subunit CydD [Aeromicrobium sp. 9AM]